MTIEALDKALSTLRAEWVIEFFDGMPEKERKEHAKRAIEWLEVSSIHNSTDSEFLWYLPGGRIGARIGPAFEPPKRIKKMLEQLEQAKKKAAKLMPPQAVRAEAVAVANIAVLASAGLTDIKKHWIIPSADYCYEVLSKRKPSWMGNWVEWITEEAPHSHFTAVRRLEREGIIQIEHSPNYLTAMAPVIAWCRAAAATKMGRRHGRKSSALRRHHRQTARRGRGIAADTLEHAGRRSNDEIDSASTTHAELARDARTGWDAALHIDRPCRRPLVDRSYALVQ